MALNPAVLKLVSQSQAKYSGGNTKTEKPKEGRTTYRVLAPYDAPWVQEQGGQFWADLGVHWIKPGENAKPIVVVGDSETVYQTINPINTAIALAVENAHDEESKKLFESWKARKSVLVNALNRETNEVVVLELTTTTYGKYLDLLHIYAAEDQDITDLADGTDIVITRVGKGLNTEYSVAASPAAKKPITKAQIEACTDLKKFIASNYFRGEETKALNAISQIACVPMPRIGGGNVATPTAALTSSAAVVEDAQITQVVMTPAQLAAIKAADEAQEKDRKAAELRAQLAALEATTAPAPAPAPASVAETVLSDADQDAILAELDGIMNA